MRPPSDATIAALRKLLFGLIGPYTGFGLVVWMVATRTATTELLGGAGMLLLLKLGDTAPPTPPAPPPAS